MTARDPSSVVAKTGMHLVYSPGTPPLGDTADVPLTQAFAAFLAAKREKPTADTWLTLIAQHATEKIWVRVRVFPELHTLGDFPENKSRISCRGHAIVLNEDGTDGETFGFNLELSIADRAPRENLGVLDLFTR
jgi:hypothetical protein